MVKASLITELPKIVSQGQREAKRILDRLRSPYKITLETEEKVIPSRESAGLFSGQTGEDKGEESYNKLLYGDNLLIMQALLQGDEARGVPSLRGKIDLIYIDPPFNSKAEYRSKVTLRQGQLQQGETIIEQPAYSDTWEDGTATYLKMMYPRLVLMRELLSDRGSIYVHLDWHVGHYVKVLMDDIFGKDNFRNEIIWCYSSMQTAKNTWGRKHDNIYYYAKKEPIFNVADILDPYPAGYSRRFKYQDDKGFFMVRSKTGQGDLSLEDEKKNPDGTYRQYMQGGSLPKDWWEINFINSNSRERVNYNTQKPEELLERIIKASSHKDSLVADFFAGSGTTGVTAEKLGRRWLMADIGKPASLVMKKRLINLGARPFLQQNIEKHHREVLTLNRTFTRIGDLSRAVLQLYGATPMDFGSPNLGHVKKSQELVLIDSPARTTGLSTLKKAQDLRQSFLGSFASVTVLGWNIPLDMGQTLKVLGDNHLQVRILPANLMYKLKVKQGGGKLAKEKILFQSPRYLHIEPIKRIRLDDENERLTITLKDYVVLYPEPFFLGNKDAKTLQDILRREPLSLLDFLSVDPDYDGNNFINRWQFFRDSGTKNTGKSKSLDKITLTVPIKEGDRRVCVKVVDLFGCESLVCAKASYKF